MPNTPADRALACGTLFSTVVLVVLGFWDAEGSGLIGNLDKVGLKGTLDQAYEPLDQRFRPREASDAEGGKAVGDDNVHVVITV